MTTGSLRCSVPDPAAAVCQVGDLLQLRLEQELTGFTIVSERSAEVAADESDGDVIRLFLVAHDFDNALMQGSTFHTATFEIEVVTRCDDPGSLSRAGMNAIARIIAAVAEDRSLGGVLHDLQEIDAASTAANGKDANGVSLQLVAQFFTSRDDWFTIVT